jgi:hypothetical protein
MACGFVIRFTRRVSVMVFTALLLWPTLAFAQSAWRARREQSRTNVHRPLARSLALVAIVIGGLMFMSGEGNLIQVASSSKTALVRRPTMTGPSDLPPHPARPPAPTQRFRPRA